MATIDELKAQVATLKQAETDREARDAAQDAVTAAQVAALNTTIAELQAIIAAGGLTPQQQADLDGMAVDIKAVVDSLNAADPTPPAI
jgi:dethiobiotin synthetase